MGERRGRSKKRTPIEDSQVQTIWGGTDCGIVGGQVRGKQWGKRWDNCN